MDEQLVFPDAGLKRFCCIVLEGASTVTGVDVGACVWILYQLDT